MMVIVLLYCLDYFLRCHYCLNFKEIFNCIISSKVGLTDLPRVAKKYKKRRAGEPSEAPCACNHGLTGTAVSSGFERHGSTLYLLLLQLLCPQLPLLVLLLLILLYTDYYYYYYYYKLRLQTAIYLLLIALHYLGLSTYLLHCNSALHFIG